MKFQISIFSAFVMAILPCSGITYAEDMFQKLSAQTTPKTDSRGFINVWQLREDVSVVEAPEGEEENHPGNLERFSTFMTEIIIEAIDNRLKLLSKNKKRWRVMNIHLMLARREDTEIINKAEFQPDLFLSMRTEVLEI